MQSPQDTQRLSRALRQEHKLHSPHCRVETEALWLG